MEQKFENFKTKYNYNDSGNTFLWSVLAPYLVGILTLFVAFVIAKAMNVEVAKISDSTGFIIASAILTPLSFATVFFMYNKLYKIPFSACSLRFNTLNLRTILFLIIIPIVCVFGLQYFITGTELGLEAIGFNIRETQLPLTNIWWLLLNIALLALLPAIAEELIFRGIIFNGLRTKFNEWVAVVFSALLFALMHGSLDQLVYPFILGMVLAWIVLRTNSLVSSMIVHFLNNAIVLTLGFVKKTTGFSFILPPSWLFWVLAIVLAIATFGILFLLEKFFFKKQKPETLQSNQKSISMIAGIVVASILFLISTISSFIN